MDDRDAQEIQKHRKGAQDRSGNDSLLPKAEKGGSDPGPCDGIIVRRGQCLAFVEAVSHRQRLAD
jgi:hypothetical protein